MVELTAERWAHILLRHPWLQSYMGEVLRAVQEPTACLPDPDDEDAEQFYLRGGAGVPWLRVVVAFKHNRAFIVTALRQHRAPWTH